MAEELSKYLDRVGVRNRYIHSDVDTLERVQILEDLRAGMFDVLIGVNLLREGLVKISDGQGASLRKLTRHKFSACCIIRSTHFYLELILLFTCCFHRIPTVPSAAYKSRQKHRYQRNHSSVIFTRNFPF